MSKNPISNSVDPIPSTLKAPKELLSLNYMTSVSSNIFNNTETVKSIHSSTRYSNIHSEFIFGIGNREMNKRNILNLMGLMNSQMSYCKDVCHCSSHYCFMSTHGEIFFPVPRPKIIMLLLSNLLIFTF